jgi:hypothetical protein
MKVTFTCEKCGVERDQCPRCDLPTCGPLTEGMVAEALCEARRSNDLEWASWEEANAMVKRAFLAEARFVLRLMRSLDADAHHWGLLHGDAECIRRILLDFARNPR